MSTPRTSPLWKQLGALLRHGAQVVAGLDDEPEAAIELAAPHPAPHIERKQLETWLRVANAALEAAANAIVVCDREGRIIWANPAFTQLTGYTLDEARGQTMRLLKSGRHAAAFYQELWATILAGQVWHGETINRRKDGRLYVEEQIIAPVRDEHGAITHFISIKQALVRNVDV
jgi:PAS domain S-box-containing protein